nr:protein let-756 [Leptinotarsa decemlineata]
MVKTLLLGLLAATICGFVNASPIAADLRNPKKLPPRQDLEDPETEAPPLDDPAARSERSTNLSNITGGKLKMFIKNRHLQILPDGTVNGTTDDTSAYSILQRTAVGIGQMKIQGVATCQYLCMAKCGLLYGSRDFGDECVFNETIEQSHYNTYSSSKYSNAHRTFYLALNQRGQSRKVVLRAQKHLGRLASYILVLTRPVSAELQLHPMRHHAHSCPLPAAHQTPKIHPHQQLCPKKRKRKKRKRKCTSVENESESCQKRQNVPKHKAQNRNNHKCDDDKTSEMCQRDLHNKKKQKFNISDKLLVSDPKKKRKNKKGVKKRLNQFESETTTTTTVPTSTTLEYTTPDEDYGVDLSTHADWEDSTALPDVHMAVSDAMHTVPPLVDSD